MAITSRYLLALVAMICSIPVVASAQDREVPYWASLAAPEVNMRVGPSERYRIDWVYHREGLPVKVIRLQQGWRLIEEPDGTQGWVFNQLLSLRRTAIVIGDGEASLRELPEDGANLLWKVEPGVTGRLAECREGFCELEIDGRIGWIAQDRLWGAGEP